VTDYHRRSSGSVDAHFRLLYESLLASIPSSLLLIDSRMCVITANANFLTKARRTTGNTLGRRLDDVFPRVLLDNSNLEQKIRAVFTTGQSVEGGKISYRAPGMPSRTYFYRLTPIMDSATVAQVMLLLDDITEQERLAEEVRRVERHLASVVESANDLMLSIDPEGRILTWNRAAEVISGWSADQMIGRTTFDLWPNHQTLMTDVQGQLVRGVPVPTVELSLATQDGRQVAISWSFSIMRNQQEQIIGLVAVGRDLTEHRRLEAQVLQAAKMASLGIMAGGIAHEIRNPLGIISVAAQLLGERPDDIHLRGECLRRIRTGVQSASQIIEGLLKFARPPDDHVGPLQLASALDEALDLVSSQIKVHRVNLERNLDPGLPLVAGNRSLLQQVFTNLILNACNAMPRGGNLRISSRLNALGQVELSFADTGRGITSMDMDKIFDPFFTTMPAGQGVGLGLTIAYSIIRQHKGTIQVQSEPGRGSTFTIALPPAPPVEGREAPGA
jgi:PAS domain S-box-containing protein